MDLQRTQSVTESVWLYQTVYQVPWLRAVVLAVVCFFILHPVMPALAATDEAAEAILSDDEPAPATTEAAASTEPTEAEPQSVTEPVADEVLSEGEGDVTLNPAAGEEDVPAEAAANDREESAVTTADEDHSVEETPPSTAVSEAEADDSGSEPMSAAEGDEPATTTTNSIDVTAVDTESDSVVTSSTNNQSTSTTETDVVESEVATTTDTEAATSSRPAASTTEDESSSASNEPSQGSNDSASATSSSSDPVTTTPTAQSDSDDDTDSENPVPTVAGVATTTPVTDTASSSESQFEGEGAVVSSTPRGEFEFTKQECREVEDGSYYCVRQDTTSAVDTPEGAIVFAAADVDGDTEIYYNNGKTVTQITRNAVADAAPHYDATSHSITWHSLRNDRYQIVTYDIAADQVTEVTATSSNNMEPSRDGQYIVWQRWIENNWEVILFDGEAEIQVTDNNSHDLLPDVQDGFVVWNSDQPGGDSRVMVYEIASGMRSAIDDTDGGQVANPRFVLVYDTKFANGDSITKGFDPRTGKLIPLAAQPGELPPEIPDSDSTGETRALIQNKNPNSRDDDDSAVEPVPVTPPDTADTGTTTAAMPASTSTPDVSTEPVDINMTSPSTSTGDTLPLTDEDIVVEPYTPTDTEPTDDRTVTTTTTTTTVTTTVRSRASSTTIPVRE